MINKIVIVRADDWEGLFINDKLVDEGHTLNEGYSRTKYLKELCNNYDAKLSDIIEGYVTDDYYDNVLSVRGGFPNNLSEVNWEIDE